MKSKDQYWSLSWKCKSNNLLSKMENAIFNQHSCALHKINEISSIIVNDTNELLFIQMTLKMLNFCTFLWLTLPLFYECAQLAMNECIPLYVIQTDRHDRELIPGYIDMELVNWYEIFMWNIWTSMSVSSYFFGRMYYFHIYIALADKLLCKVADTYINI